MTAYYNEIDPFAAQWLRELIKQGHIAPGIVDERSIEDVRPDELYGFTQCHFFAGIGVWSHALRRAGWPDDRPVWTGSCPCQPFSSAGKGGGFADQRHLWPAFHWLIDQCRPVCVFGEQVAGKAGETWFDVVSTDLENAGYTCGAAVTAACGFGAPHKRTRLYWVGHTSSLGLCGGGQNETKQSSEMLGAGSEHSVWNLADNQGQRLERRGREDGGGRGAGVSARCNGPGSDCVSGSLADSNNEGPQGRICGRDCADERFARPRSVGGEGRGPTNGFWGNADWLGCRDGKWRPVESVLKPLANGAAARVGRLRGYGNAIVAQQAQAFIEAFMSLPNAPDNRGA